MCLLAFAIARHPDHPLILLANRDEFHQRPAAALHWWQDQPILAGRDLEAGGTWLGVDRGGRLAAVTNYRERPLRAGTVSRGTLPVDFLGSDQPAADFAAALQTRHEAFAGYNLLLFDGDGLFVSNRRPDAVPLAPGVHGISNGGLDDGWPKVVRTREALARQIDADRISESDLLPLLTDREPPPDPQLPDTGVGLELERFLSPPFIVSDRYGTRACTLVWISAESVRVVEHRFGADAEPLGRTEVSFPFSPRRQP